MSQSNLRCAGACLLVAAVVLSMGMLSGTAVAQGPPVAPPKVGPKAGPPPRPTPSDRAKRAKTKQRKDATSKDDTSSPGGGTSPGPAPKPKAARKPSAAAVSRANRLLDAMASAARRRRDETWSGHATLIDRLGTRSSIPLRVTRVWRGGECRALIEHGREGDLPNVVHLFVVDATGKSAGWTWRSEEKRVVERAGIDDRIGRSALAYADLVEYDVARHGVVYEDSTIFDGKRASVFAGAPRSKRTHARAVFDVRGDHKLVGRVKLYRSGEDPWREVRFADVKHVGVFRVWYSAVVRDHERSATALVKVETRQVNRGLDFDAFTAEGLPALLKR